MKIISLCTITAQAYEISSRQVRLPRQVEQEDRSMNEFKAVFNHFNNMHPQLNPTGDPNFDAVSNFRSYFISYGCHCFDLLNSGNSGSAMTKMGTGAPLDELDGLCKKYKECVQCAMGEHQFGKVSNGDKCDATFVRYSFDVTQPVATSSCDGMQTNNKNNRCRKALCECDVMFATQFPGVFTAFKPEHSHTNGPWINDEKCPQQTNGKGNGNGGSNKECCYVRPDVGSTIHFNILVNKNTHTCTATGSSEI